MEKERMGSCFLTSQGGSSSVILCSSRHQDVWITEHNKTLLQNVTFFWAKTRKYSFFFIVTFSHSRNLCALALTFFTFVSCVMKTQKKFFLKSSLFESFQRNFEEQKFLTYEAGASPPAGAASTSSTFSFLPLASALSPSAKHSQGLKFLSLFFFFGNETPVEKYSNSVIFSLSLLEPTLASL